MHPILLQLGPLNLRAYGLAMALSFLLGLALAGRFNRREGRRDEDLLDLALWIMGGAVAGARALYVAVNWPEFAAGLRADLAAGLLELLAVWHGGLVFYGGLIGGFLAAYAFLRRRGLPVWSYADALAPGLALGQVTGRLGCFLNGCCYGVESRGGGLVFPALGDGVPRLPVMLYEAAFCLALAGALAWAWGRRRFQGQLFWSYALAYACWRFGIEFLRGDAERGSLLSPRLSPSQWISLLAAAAGLAMLLRLSRRPGLRLP